MLFAETFIKKYHEILHHQAEDEFKDQHTLYFMSVQLFTSPSLSLFLIEKSNALGRVLNALESALSDEGNRIVVKEFDNETITVEPRDPDTSLDRT